MNPSSSVFEIKLSRRIWRVTLDGAFYGDYRTRRHTDEAPRPPLRRCANKDAG